MTRFLKNFFALVFLSSFGLSAHASMTDKFDCQVTFKGNAGIPDFDQHVQVASVRMKNWADIPASTYRNVISQGFVPVSPVGGAMKLSLLLRTTFTMPDGANATPNQAFQNTDMCVFYADELPAECRFDTSYKAVPIDANGAPTFDPSVLATFQSTNFKYGSTTVTCSYLGTDG